MSVDDDDDDDDSIYVIYGSFPAEERCFGSDRWFPNDGIACRSVISSKPSSTNRLPRPYSKYYILLLLLLYTKASNREWNQRDIKRVKISRHHRWGPARTHIVSVRSVGLRWGWRGTWFARTAALAEDYRSPAKTVLSCCSSVVVYDNRRAHDRDRQTDRGWRDRSRENIIKLSMKTTAGSKLQPNRDRKRWSDRKWVKKRKTVWEGVCKREREREEAKASDKLYQGVFF